MANILRVRCTLTNFPGAPGYTSFYVTDEVGQTNINIAAFWGTIKDLFPGGTLITIPGDAERFDDATGQVNGSVDVGDTLTATSTGTGAYAGPAGAVQSWVTSDFKNGRRVRGRSYLVPLLGGHYDTDGTLTSAARNLINGAAVSLVNAQAGELLVWSRPTVSTPGSSHVITSSPTADMVAVLRSRRT